MDHIELQNINNNLLKNKIIITKNEKDEYVMFEGQDIKKENIKMTKLKYQQTVDFVILNDYNTEYDNIKEIIDENTIITKNLGNNIVYIEDAKNEWHMISTDNEKILIKGHGIETEIKYYETSNN